MTEPSPVFTKLGEVRPSALWLNLAAIPLGIAWVAGLVLLTGALPWRRDLGGAEPWVALGAIVGLLVLHELAHALIWKLRTRLPWSEFKFGFNPKALMFYCHCRATMTVSDYRWGALAPLVTLGPLSLVGLLICPATGLAVAAGLHLAGCIGDITILVGLRRFGSDTWVRDHPTEAGCEVFALAPQGLP